jgi:hypothetical protein
MLIRTAKQNPSFFFTQIGNAAGIQANRKTIKKILNTADLFSFVALKKPLLSGIQVQNRLDWATRKLDYDLNAWHNWTFSDES